MERGSSAGIKYTIDLNSTDRSGEEINSEVKSELKKLGFIWYKDYYTELSKKNLYIFVYNDKVAKAIPNIIVEDLI